jgi:glucose dehydrogenase
VASILAVKPDTGELKWYFQPVPGDSWYYESVQQLMLADLSIKGRPCKVRPIINPEAHYGASTITLSPGTGDGAGLHSSLRGQHL